MELLLAVSAATTVQAAQPTTAAASTRTFSAVADARVAQAHPGRNYGRSRDLRVHGARSKVLSYVRFTVNGLRGAVHSARLRLYVTSGKTDTLRAHATRDPWSETGITWRNRPPATSALRRERTRAAPARRRRHGVRRRWVAFNATPVVAGNGSYSFVLATSSRHGLSIASRESRRHRPTLVIETAAGGGQPQNTSPPAAAGGPVRPPASGVYFGAYTSSTTGQTVEQREAEIGRKYEIVHFYQGWNEAGTFPNSYESRLAEGGRVLYLGWTARNYATGNPTPWADIAAGKYDAAIDQEAAKIKAFGRPLLMDFTHEPEVQIEAGGYGSAADFVAAYRHIVQRFRADGVTNVSWVWDVGGSSDHWTEYPGLYPGDDVVDWIAWDPYNWYLCHSTGWRSFADTVRPFYDWLMAHGHASKPFMLGEYGSRESDVDPAAKGRWFVDALGPLRGGMFPNLKAMIYFDSQRPECNWRLDTSQASMAGYRQLASDPYLNP